MPLYEANSSSHHVKDGERTIERKSLRDDEKPSCHGREMRREGKAEHRGRRSLKFKTLKIEIKGYSISKNLITSSNLPSHYAFVSTTSTSKKMSYAESPSFSSSTTYSAPSSSKARSHSSGNVLQDVLHSLVAESEPEQQVAYEDLLKQIDNRELRRDGSTNGKRLCCRSGEISMRKGWKVD
ncbi:hypothetical protein Tco_1336505 [Tanacetum coccineum]